MRLRSMPGLLPLLAMMSMVLILSGCVQIAVESEFESDGSARHSIASTIDRSFLDDPMLGEELDGELDFEEIEREATAAGLDAEEIDEADRVGVRVSMSVDDNEDLGEVLDELFSSLDANEPLANGFTGGFTQSGGGIGGTTYRFELTVDGDALFPSDEEELGDELEDEFGMDMGMDMMRQFIDLTYTVSMPGEITEHNGTSQGPDRVQWELPLQGSETFIAESEDGSGISMALILGIGVGVIAVVLIVVGGIVLMRGPSAPVASSSAAGETPPEPVHPVTGQPDPVIEVETRDDTGLDSNRQ